MSKFLKYKKLFIMLMAVLAVVTVATAFSVSYAKWTSSGSQMSSDGKTGTWDELYASYQIEFSDGTYEYFIRSEVSGKYSYLFTVNDSETKNFKIIGNTNGFDENINIITSGGISKPCVTLQEQEDYKYRTTDAGEYEIVIDSKVKTISFVHYATEYSYKINFSDHSSKMFIYNEDAKSFTVTFSIDTDLSFNIFKNEEIVTFTAENITISGNCVTSPGTKGYNYTTTGLGMYTAVIKGEKIEFTCTKESSLDASFIKAVNSPGPMKIAIGSDFGILTSNGNIVLFNTAEGRSNYFTLKKSRYFAILIAGVRINNSNYSQLTIPVDGIEPNPGVVSGSNTHLYLVNKEGTFYVTYDKTSKTPKDIVIKSVDRAEFQGAIATTSDGIKRGSASFAKTEADGEVSYNTKFTITDGSNKNFNVYLNDVKTDLEIDGQSKQYITKNESGDYAFTFKATGTFDVTVKDNVLTVTSDDAEFINTVKSITVGGDASVIEGSVINLSATVTGELGPITNKKVTWSVDDKTVATISENGELKGVKAGTVNVTASLEGVTSNAFTVTVVKEKVVSVTVDGEQQVEEGKQINLSATVTGELNNTLTDRTVIWTVDNEDRASITQEGVFTAIAAGNVKVTATADGVASAEFAVTVIEKEKVASIQIIGATTVEAGKQITLTVTATGTYGSVWTDYKPVVWSVDDPGVATIEDGKLNGVAEGTVNVTATVEGVVPVTITVTVTENVTASEAKTITFIDGQPSDTVFTHTGSKYSAKNAAFTIHAYSETEQLASGLKMESSTQLTLTLSGKMRLTLYFDSAGNVKINGTDYSTEATAAGDNVKVIELEAGSYTIEKGDKNGSINLYYATLEPIT